MLKHEHDLTIFGRSEVRRMNDTMLLSQCWSHIANDVFTYVQACPPYRKKLSAPDASSSPTIVSNGKTARISRRGSTETLQKTTTGRTFTVVKNYKYSKLSRAKPTKKTIATDVARIFVDDWVVPYGVTNWLLSYSVSQFAGK